jgi:hypothetical protein
LRALGDPRDFGYRLDSFWVEPSNNYKFDSDRYSNKESGLSHNPHSCILQNDFGKNLPSLVSKKSGTVRGQKFEYRVCTTSFSNSFGKFRISVEYVA